MTKEKDKKEEVALTGTVDENTSLTAENVGDIDYIKMLTGEFSSSVKKDTYISFNGNEGKFYQGSGESKVEIGGEVNGILIKSAVKIETAYSSKKPQVYTRELNGMPAEITLYSKDTGEEVETGVYDELKDKYDLSFKNILYISLDEMNKELVKLNVGGASLAPLWKYLNTFGAQSMIQFKTKLVGQEYDSDLGGKKYKISFTRLEELSKEDLQPALDMLSEIIKNGNLTANKKTQKLVEGNNEGNIDVTEIAF